MEKRIRKYFIVIISGILLCILTLGSILFTSTMRRVYLDQMERTNENLAEQIRSSFELVIQQISEQVNKHTIYESQLGQFVRESQVTVVNYIYLYEDLKQIVLGNQYIHSVYLYSEEDQTFFDSKRGNRYTIGEFYDQTVAEAIQSNYRANVWPHLIRGDVLVYSFAEELKGCEDPRIVEFEGSNYVFYTAYDGNKARVSIARTEDFYQFEKLGVIDHAEYDKDAFIFPERVGGKIAYMHRIAPNIQIDYFDSFEELLSGTSWKAYSDKLEASTMMRREFDWENRKIGGSVPPIKCDRGWVLLYHAVDNQGIYRGGAALLDSENPSLVIGRLPYPILEPTEDFEKFGDVNNVVFPEGAYVHDGLLNVYYGAADKYIAVAEIDFEILIAELLRSHA